MISTPLGSSRVHADRAEEGDLAVKELLQQHVVSSLVGNSRVQHDLLCSGCQGTQIYGLGAERLLSRASIA